MRSFFRFSLLLLAVFSLGSALCYADDEGSDSKKSRAELKREAKEAKDAAKKAAAEAKKEALEARKAKSKGKDVMSCDLSQEMSALGSAEQALRGIKNEEDAKAIVKEFSKIFTALPAPTSGTAAELEKWAVAQNKVNDAMEELRKQEYFKSAGLQDLWTLITDPFSRRRALPAKR